MSSKEKRCSGFPKYLDLIVPAERTFLPFLIPDSTETVLIAPDLGTG